MLVPDFSLLTELVPQWLQHFHAGCLRRSSSLTELGLWFRCEALEKLETVVHVPNFSLFPLSTLSLSRARACVYVRLCVRSRAHACLPMCVRACVCARMLVYVRVCVPLFVSVCACVPLCVCCLLYTSPSPRDWLESRMPSSA